MAETRISRTPKGRKPQYFQDPATDKLLSMVMTLASELSVTRERLDALERVLEGSEVMSRAQLEHFEPDPPAEEERQTERQRLVDRLLEVVVAELEETEGDFPQSREALVNELEREEPS